MSDDKPTPTPPAPKKSKASKLTVSEHAQLNYPPATGGNVVDGVRMPHPDRWKHEAAAALHNWAEHKHHQSEEVRLSASDYKKAIEAACSLDDKGIPVPHEAAFCAVPTVKA